MRLRSIAAAFGLLWLRTRPMGAPQRGAHGVYSNVFFWRAPCKGGAFQWVQGPPGNRSSRKHSEQDA